MSFYICSNCGYGSASWIGKCPDCGSWNTLMERADARDEKKSKTGRKAKPEKLQLVSLSKVESHKKGRLKTGIFEIDRVLGGGFVPGEVMLLTGEPGVGKSTLLLQALAALNTVYISGEESATEVKSRAERLKIDLDKFSFADTVQVEGIVEGLGDIADKIDILVIDSIQTIYSGSVDSPQGSVSSLKEVANQLISFAKKHHIAVILIGHITKEGTAAGPKTLEHLVDCVLSFEGEKISNFRILRALKNRYGGTDEIGIFEMKGSGLSQVNNPLAFLEEQEKGEVAGRAIVGVAEGNRPLFFEIQTLTVSTQFAVARRVVKGVDYNKVQLILAVLRKNLGLSVLDRFDVYVNVVGGVNIRSTAADLGIAASVISAFKNILVPKKSVFIGEVGLLGEVRKAVGQEKIVSESKRLNFKNIVSSDSVRHISDLKKIFKI